MSESEQVFKTVFEATIDEMDQYLGYIGGPAGALALTGVAAASAFYLASRPTAEKPLVDLNNQAPILPLLLASATFLPRAGQDLSDPYEDEEHGPVPPDKEGPTAHDALLGATSAIM